MRELLIWKYIGKLTRANVLDENRWNCKESEVMKIVFGKCCFSADRCAIRPNINIEKWKKIVETFYSYHFLFSCRNWLTFFMVECWILSFFTIYFPINYIRKTVAFGCPTRLGWSVLTCMSGIEYILHVHFFRFR